MGHTESSEQLSPAGAAFAEFLMRRESGAEPGFEEFCAEHPELRAELRRLHERWSAMMRALDSVVGDATGPRSDEPGPEASPQLGPESDPEDSSGEATLDSAASLLSRLGTTRRDRYSTKREIARGGMGVVYKVWDVDLRRNLAMKVLARGAPERIEPRALSRFLEEAQITGQLEHPGIVAVHELGLDAHGRIYFTMPLVRGKNLQQIIDEVHGAAGDWTLIRALGVIIRVCEAMGYAHSKGVLHRDLKPSNVMVGAFGETHVMDWGLARVLGEADRRDILIVPEAEEVSTELRTVRRDAAETPGSPLVTRDGDVVGTPVFMSPEQAHGWIEEMGPTSDVYSIGAMLYYLLTGRRPFLADDRERSTEAVLKAVKSRVPRPIHELAPSVPVELEAICEKAMGRDPADRYASTMLMAADLRAFLEMRVVSAHDTSTFALLRKWIVRNRWLATASGLAMLSLIGGVILSTTLFFQATEERAFAIEQKRLADIAAATAASERARADRSARRIAAELRSTTIERARLLARAGTAGPAEDLLWRAYLADPHERHALWTLREYYSRQPSLTRWRVAPGRAFAEHLDDERVLSTSSDGVVRLWNLRTAELDREVQAHEGLCCLAVSAAGDRLATGGYEDLAVKIWGLPGLTLAGEVEAHLEGVRAVAWHPNGSRLVSSGGDGVVREWSWPGLSLVREHDAGLGVCFDPTYSPSGRDLAFMSAHGGVHLWSGDAAAPTTVGRKPPIRRGAIAFGAEEGTFFAGSSDGEIHEFHPTTGAARGPFQAWNGTIRDLAVVGAQQRLLAVGYYRLDFWDLAAPGRRYSYHLPAGAAWTASVSPDTKRVAIAADGKRGDGEISVWESHPRAGTYRLDERIPASALAFSPDRRTLCVGDEDGVVHICDAHSGVELRSFRAHRSKLMGMDFNGDGSVLATVAYDAQCHVWHLASQSRLATFDGVMTPTTRPIDLSADAAELACIGPGASAFVVDVQSGHKRAVVPPGAGPKSLSVALLPGGSFAIASNDRRFQIWSAAAEEKAGVPVTGTGVTISVSPDGRRMATGTWSKTIEIIDSETGRVARTLQGHSGTVWDTAFHPTDPNLLASCADDHTVRLWDLSNGQSLVTIDVREEIGNPIKRASTVRFSPDGLTLAAICYNTVLVWDLTYYDRHIAGNLSNQLSRLGPEIPGLDEESLRAWATSVLARPWPRLGFSPGH
ncbi:MAG: serine/threonine-protein kinase [Planctomycetota bacterium]